MLSSIELTRQILIELGSSADEALDAVEFFREHDEKSLQQQHAIHHDEEALVQSAKESRDQLRRLFDLDAAEAARKA